MAAHGETVMPKPWFKWPTDPLRASQLPTSSLAPVGQGGPRGKGQLGSRGAKGWAPEHGALPGAR
jgi:hypothetical protein